MQHGVLVVFKHVIDTNTPGKGAFLCSRFRYAEGHPHERSQHLSNGQISLSFMDYLRLIARVLGVMVDNPSNVQRAAILKTFTGRISCRIFAGKVMITGAASGMASTYRKMYRHARIDVGHRKRCWKKQPPNCRPPG